MSNMATIITEVTALIPIVVAIIYILNGLKCLLRSEMLRIYYSHKEKAEAEGKPKPRVLNLFAYTGAATVFHNNKAVTKFVFMCENRIITQKIKIL